MKLRTFIFWPHLIAGVLAGVVILIMSVTGVALMYQKQMTEWADGPGCASCTRANSTASPARRSPASPPRLQSCWRLRVSRS